ncbi:MAG TPA: PDZ domain-containing protein [Longimicrobium sp.]|jgi:C-terminal processing protease CtpA/Prc|uniref:PDZ domain-containing protein n=1 Tax=Longimicrobium sp. TaxID=2029185 RepID=UPI002ED799C0
MKWRIAVLLAATVVCAADASGQGAQPPREGAVRGESRNARNTAYTGIGVQGRPSPAPDGTPRWADYPVVHAVTQGSPAARVGILPGDVLLLVNGTDARDPRTLFGEPGKVFTIRIRRGSSVREFVLASIRRPNAPAM